MNNQLVDQAIQFAIDHETRWPREVGEDWGIHQFDPPPWNRLLGPVHGRGPVSGTILQDGRRVVSWGEPDRADLTFSVAKTYLALLAGVAHDRGLLPNVQEPVVERVPGIGFDTAHNAGITWEHLLQQTSEWQGECFGVPDTVDRYRTVQFQDIVLSGQKGDARPLSKPGGFWEYNDVRVNQFSLALLHLFGRPLPDILREEILDPLGASGNWQWISYDHAWVNIGGTRMRSVPGGSHWGGGLSISSHDQALVGQMLLDGGRARGKQILSREWLSRMCAPCAIAPFYGYLLWLNQGRRIFPSAPETSFFAFGAGSSFTWIDPEHRTVVIVRWIDADHADTFFAKVSAALQD